MPIILFLDDDELADICPEIDDPVESLRSAVLSELRQTDKPTIFDHIDRRIAAWRAGGQDQPPPILPLLAATVLAGGRMQRDESFTAGAYYPRLVDLMSPGRNSITAHGLQKHFDQVAEMWQLLDRWILAHQETLGPSTIVQGSYSRIGYPLSQTVLKVSDRERLSDFFARIRSDEHSESSPQELLRLLRMWMSKPKGFSRTFVEVVQGGSGNLLLMAVISKLAAQERSESAAYKRRVKLELSMSIDPGTWSVSWVVPVRSEVQRDDFDLGGGAIVTLATPAYGSVYDVVAGTLPEGAQTIDSEFKAVGAGAVLSKKARPLWVLRTDPFSGNWQSVALVEPGERYLLLVRNTADQDMQDFLAANAEPDYWRHRRELFPGRTVYENVCLKDRSYKTSQDNLVGLAGLGDVESASSPTLTNGLPLRTDVGGRHYLAGGEPDVLIPDSGSEAFALVVIDSKRPGQPVRKNGSTFPLRKAGPFVDGKHTVEVDGKVLEFFVHAIGDAAQMPGARASATDTENFPNLPTEEGLQARYALCRRGQNAAMWFIFPEGRVLKVCEPKIPRFFSSLGVPNSYMWKVQVPDGASWHVTERGGKFSDPTRLSAQEANFGRLNGVAQAFWRRVASDTITSPDQKWRSYLSQSMEGSIRGR